ncbi:MAG TPA: phosphotransferase [Caulobacteraceae bacterium]|nr:phosphotransferase [Caulobacteraceae bacterium]
MADRYVPSGLQGAPPAALTARVEAALGRAWSAWSKPSTGLSAAHRFLVELDDGTSVFVKGATTAQTAAWLRNERAALGAAPAFAPKEVAWIDDGDDFPILVVEALVEAYWPVQAGGTQWRAGDLERVFAAIKALSELQPPPVLPADQNQRASDGWKTILASPEAFLRLQLCSAAWLDRHGETLSSAAAALDWRGEAFVHGDMRSDNICLTDDAVTFVDWSEARRGAAATDLALFLPTAHLEGGPAPASVMPHGGPWAAQQSAELALRAADETRGAPPWLLRVFRRLARINLDWAIEDLGLPARDK